MENEQVDATLVINKLKGLLSEAHLQIAIKEAIIDQKNAKIAALESAGEAEK